MTIENRKVLPFAERVKSAKRTIRSHSVDGIERRTVPAGDIEVRVLDGDAGLYEMVGHAAVFGDLSEDLGFFESWYERIAEGAFASVLRKNPDVRCLFNHDSNYVLGRTSAGTLELDEDEVGLFYRCAVGDTSYGRDLRTLLERGDVTQSSFAFRVARHGDTWEEDDDGNLVRTIHQFSELYDVSPVTYPAYTTTDVGLASHDLVAEADDDRNFDEVEDAPDGDDPDTSETCTGANGCPACDNPADCPQGPSGGEQDTAPDGERHDDEPARQRVEDGPTVDTAADEPTDEDPGAWRLAIRRRRMSVLEALGRAPTDN